MDLTFAIIGPGSVGSMLERSLDRAGCSIYAVLGKDDRLESLLEPVDVILICTPDDQISKVATDLSDLARDWSGTTVAHVSGVLTSEVLRPLAKLGAGTVSFHPLGAYPPAGPAKDLRETTVAIEGEESSVARMAQVASALGAIPITLSPAQKAAYHLAASMGSNFLVTLTAAVHDILRAAQLDERLMDGLIADTFENLASEPAADALTGPIARGDLETVGLHLRTIEQMAPKLGTLYAALARATADLAFSTGRISVETRDALRAMLSRPED